MTTYTFTGCSLGTAETHRKMVITTFNADGTVKTMERCKITGKRYGIVEHVKRDSKFRARGFERCNAAAPAKPEG